MLRLLEDRHGAPVLVETTQTTIVSGFNLLCVLCHLSGAQPFRSALQKLLCYLDSRHDCRTNVLVTYLLLLQSLCASKSNRGDELPTPPSPGTL